MKAQKMKKTEAEGFLKFMSICRLKINQNSRQKLDPVTYLEIVSPTRLLAIDISMGGLSPKTPGAIKLS
jgi:hypothetical protein